MPEKNETDTNIGKPRRNRKVWLPAGIGAALLIIVAIVILICCRRVPGGANVTESSPMPTASAAENTPAAAEERETPADSPLPTAEQTAVPVTDSDAAAAEENAEQHPSTSGTDIIIEEPATE